jgi:hypothetical protein
MMAPFTQKLYVIKLIQIFYIMKLKKIIISVLFFALPFMVVAQQTTKEITDKIFKIYKESPEKAIAYGFSTNKWFENNKKAIDDLETKLMNLIGIVGNYNGYEKILEKKIGNNYKLETYMMKYDRQPIKFTFIFYKPSNEWHIQNFYFDTDFDDDVEKMAKY